MNRTCVKLRNRIEMLRKYTQNHGVIFHTRRIQEELERSPCFSIL